MNDVIENYDYDEETFKDEYIDRLENIVLSNRKLLSLCHKNRLNKNEVNKLTEIYKELIELYKNVFDDCYINKTVLLYGVKYEVLDSFIDFITDMDNYSVDLFINCKSKDGNNSLFNIEDFINGIDLPF